MDLLSQVHSNYLLLILLRGHYPLYFFTTEFNISHIFTQAYHFFTFIYLSYLDPNIDEIVILEILILETFGS